MLVGNPVATLTVSVMFARRLRAPVLATMVVTASGIAMPWILWYLWAAWRAFS
jgi:hypothetical protein